MFQNQFSLIAQEEEALKKLYVFAIQVYIKAWFQLFYIVYIKVYIKAKYKSILKLGLLLLKQLKHLVGI